MRIAKGTAAIFVASGLILSGCSAANTTSSDETSTENLSVSSDCEYPKTVIDLAGNEITIDSADSVLVTDNRAFGVLNQWGIQPTAAPRALMSANNTWKDDETILDTGSHAEPDFDQVIIADPTLIITGYRYGDHLDKLQAAAPDAAVLNMDSEMAAHQYVREQVTLLGQVFCKETEADALIAQFEEVTAETKAAYDPAMTVMGLVTSANEIRYANPHDGRGASIFFELLDLTPALDADGSSNHQGDDISIEAIAQAEPDFFLVLDRDAAVGDEGDMTPATNLIESSKALAGVPAVQNQAIYVMPADYYLTEDIYAYTEVMRGLLETFEAQDAKQ